MNNEQENFDELFRQKFAEKEFVFNEENWEKAETKIDFNRRFKKIIWWSAIFVTGLISGIALTLMFVERVNTNNTSAISEHYHQKEMVNNSVISKKENLTEETSISLLNSSTVVTTNISKPNLVKENLLKEKNVSSNESVKTVINTKKENKISTKEPIPQKRDKIVTIKKEILKNMLKDPEINVNESSEKKHKNNNVEENSEKTNLNPSLTQTVETEKSADQTKNLTISEPSNATKSNIETNAAFETQTTAIETTSKSEEKSNLEANPVKQLEIQVSGKENEKQKSDSSVVSAQNNSAAPATASPTGGLASITIFSVDAGTNIATGWKYSGVTEARGLNPVLGIGITHYFNQKWSVNSGIQYGSIAYLKTSEKVFSSTTYNFGSTSIEKAIDTKLLHYAVIPIMVHYHFNDKNSISIGGSISYLVNSKSKFTTNTTTITPIPLDSNQQGAIPIPTSSTETTETGYYSNAFNKWDASLAIGYRRRISQKFNVAAIANFGLMDIKNNTFFSQEKFERNIGLKIIVSYNVFDF